MNAQSGFLEKFIEQNGYAYWDKALVQNPTPSITTSSDTTYVTIPMALQNTSLVNSLILSKVANNNIIVEQVKDKDYVQLPLEKDATSSQLSKEDYAKYYFYFTKEVFNKKDFVIKDPLMFQTTASLNIPQQVTNEEKEPISVSLKGVFGSTPTDCFEFTTYTPVWQIQILFLNGIPIAIPVLHYVTTYETVCLSTIFTSYFAEHPPIGPVYNNSDNPGAEIPAWQINYFPEKNPELNTENDINNNIAGGYDITTYPTYNPSTTFLNINSVIPKGDFVGWGSGVIDNAPNLPTYSIPQYSIDYCKKQLEFKNRQLSNYNDAGQTYKIYDELLGPNPDFTQPNAFNEAVGYIYRSLQAGIPVVVGVDCRDGTTIPSNDNTTDHFIIITGTFGFGLGYNYFKFFDCSTSRRNVGASNNNYLQVNSNTITGWSPTIFAGTPGHHQYYVTQVRRSKPL